MDLIREHHLWQLFIYSPAEVTSATLLQLFKPVYATGPGSRDKKAFEQETMRNFARFLTALEGNYSLGWQHAIRIWFFAYSVLVISEHSLPESNATCGDILQFVTGSHAEPPMGFPNQPKVQFVHDSDRYPSASTCSLVLYLPTGINFEQLAERMLVSLANGATFSVM